MDRSLTAVYSMLTAPGSTIVFVQEGGQILTHMENIYKTTNKLLFILFYSAFLGFHCHVKFNELLFKPSVVFSI